MVQSNLHSYAAIGKKIITFTLKNSFCKLQWSHMSVIIRHDMLWYIVT